jgi:cytochrome b561
MQQQPEKFGRVTIFSHWATVLLVVGTVIIGLVSVYADGAETTRAATLVHQSIGVVIFLLVLFRIVWRFTHPTPPLPPTTPRYQKVLARLTHVLLYATLVALPITGYLGLAARGRDISMFGLFILPNPVPLSRELSVSAQDLHNNGQYVLYVLVALHIGAALFHHFVLKDGVLHRILPGKAR